MQVVATEGAVFFALMIAGLGVSLVNGILWIALHNVLYKKLDSILFLEPYFSKAELAMYSSWPLSLVKTMLYMLLISAPVFARKRRFRGFEQELSTSVPLRIASRICVSLLILTAILGVAFFLYGGALYVTNT